MWNKKTPPWAGQPAAVETPSGLVRADADEDNHLEFVGWLGDLLRRDAEAGRPARQIEFWLSAAESGQPVGRGMVKLGDKPIVFPFDWDLASSFHHLQEAIADKTLLVEQQRGQVAQINLYFSGATRSAPPRPSSNTPA